MNEAEAFFQRSLLDTTLDIRLTIFTKERQGEDGTVVFTHSNTWWGEGYINNQHVAGDEALRALVALCVF